MLFDKTKCSNAYQAVSQINIYCSQLTKVNRSEKKNRSDRVAVLYSLLFGLHSKIRPYILLILNWLLMFATYFVCIAS